MMEILRDYGDLLPGLKLVRFDESQLLQGMRDIPVDYIFISDKEQKKYCNMRTKKRAAEVGYAADAGREYVVISQKQAKRNTYFRIEYNPAIGMLEIHLYRIMSSILADGAYVFTESVEHNFATDDCGRTLIAPDGTIYAQSFRVLVSALGGKAANAIRRDEGNAALLEKNQYGTIHALKPGIFATVPRKKSLALAHLAGAEEDDRAVLTGDNYDNTRVPSEPTCKNFREQLALVLPKTFMSANHCVEEVDSPARLYEAFCSTYCLEEKPKSAADEAFQRILDIALHEVEEIPAFAEDVPGGNSRVKRFGYIEKVPGTEYCVFRMFRATNGMPYEVQRIYVGEKKYASYWKAGDSPAVWERENTMTTVEKFRFPLEQVAQDVVRGTRLQYFGTIAAECENTYKGILLYSLLKTPYLEQLAKAGFCAYVTGLAKHVFLGRVTPERFLRADGFVALKKSGPLTRRLGINGHQLQALAAFSDRAQKQYDKIYAGEMREKAHCHSLWKERKRGLWAIGQIRHALTGSETGDVSSIDDETFDRYLRLHEKAALCGMTKQSLARTFEIIANRKGTKTAFKCLEKLFRHPQAAFRKRSPFTMGGDGRLRFAYDNFAHAGNPELVVTERSLYPAEDGYIFRILETRMANGTEIERKIAEINADGVRKLADAMLNNTEYKSNTAFYGEQNLTPGADTADGAYPAENTLPAGALQVYQETLRGAGNCLNICLGDPNVFYQGYPHSSTQGVISVFEDYVAMADRIDPQEHRMQFDFNNLIDIFNMHERAIDLLRYTENEEDVEKFKKRQTKWSRWLWEDEEYAIVAPKSPKDLFVEGTTLHHCVGGYVGSVAEGHTNILFLRKKEAIDVPFFTVEVSNGNDVVQIHGACNCNISSDKDAEAFFRKWTKRKQLSTKRNYDDFY